MSDDPAQLVAPAKKRLADAMEHLGAAIEAYHDADSFRREVNAAIQEIRNADNLFTHRRPIVPGYGAWYAEWLRWSKSMLELKWLIDSRNTIVHRNEINLEGTSKITIIASYGSDERTAWGRSVDVRKSSVEIAREVRGHLRLIPGAPSHGVIRVERFWHTKELGEREVLSTLAFTHYCVSCILMDAHARLLTAVPPVGLPPIAKIQSVLEASDRSGFDVPEDARTLDVDLATGDPMYVRARPLPGLRSSDKTKEHYGQEPKAIDWGLPAHALADVLFANARIIMRVDGHHLPMVFLLKGGTVVHRLGFQVRNHSEKFAVWESIALDVQRFEADRVVTIAEAWAAPFNSDALIEHAEDSLQRREVLPVSVVGADGDNAELMAVIGRIGSHPILGKAEVVEGLIPGYCSQVFEVWTKRRSQ